MFIELQQGFVININTFKREKALLQHINTPLRREAKVQEEEFRIYVANTSPFGVMGIAHFFFIFFSF